MMIILIFQIVFSCMKCLRIKVASNGSGDNNSNNGYIGNTRLSILPFP